MVSDDKIYLEALIDEYLEGRQEIYINLETSLTTVKCIVSLCTDSIGLTSEEQDELMNKLREI